LLLWQIHKAPARFGDLKRLAPDISEKMPIQQLREMEADGIVHRAVFPEVPPKGRILDHRIRYRAGQCPDPALRCGKQRRPD